MVPALPVNRLSTNIPPPSLHGRLSPLKLDMFLHGLHFYNSVPMRKSPGLSRPQYSPLALAASTASASSTFHPQTLECFLSIAVSPALPAASISAQISPSASAPTERAEDLSLCASMPARVASPAAQAACSSVAMVGALAQQQQGQEESGPKSDQEHG